MIHTMTSPHRVRAYLLGYNIEQALSTSNPYPTAEDARDAVRSLVEDGPTKIRVFSTWALLDYENAEEV